MVTSCSSSPWSRKMPRQFMHCSMFNPLRLSVRISPRHLGHCITGVGCMGATLPSAARGPHRHPQARFDERVFLLVEAPPLLLGPNHRGGGSAAPARSRTRTAPASRGASTALARDTVVATLRTAGADPGPPAPSVQPGQQRCRGQERCRRGAFLIDGDAVRPHADQVAPEHDRLGKQGRKEYPRRTCDAHAGPQRPFRVARGRWLRRCRCAQRGLPRLRVQRRGHRGQPRPERLRPGGEAAQHASTVGQASRPARSPRSTASGSVPTVNTGAEGPSRTQPKRSRKGPGTS